ncbi:2OG-Fe(II) oxygenase [Stackebrandtia nassauensis]|uniref:Fe2OG dioxygenase domain-containing protein n=1 Tax=Stackebrandtia nassauensis (strain DSM 44728 / CIP 108903 / NRRL B-16338 / NBRC 102104 / LLR-40K-21) TaxID=446470 RepID=D3PX99_STANL|nr:2OG-Fe(II) oxygenase [Stackebrandtia nassauensis]ADD41362.1 hypothetical protein Snas_1660 [Stackebrandtia nassauensis DSM 44728]
MSNVNSHDPFFTPVTAEAFRREDIAALAAGRHAAIRVPEFLSQSTCDEILQALLAVEFESYGSARVYPQVMRFGVGVSDHRLDGGVDDSYWDAIETDRKNWLDLGLNFDPFHLCRANLGTDWPKAVRVGTRDGKPMGPGVAREPNQGFQVHFDDSRREYSDGLLDANLIAQFAFNLYLTMPEEGGETVMWRHRWQPQDENYRLPDSYGYHESVVGDVESFEIKPRAAEAILLDPGYFHAVRPSRSARRIALGFAVGLTDTGELLTWG